MIPLETLRELFDYNYWARDRQLEACSALSEEQFLRPMGNSFSSVRDVLAHLIFAEWVWLERWRGRSPTRADKQQVAADGFPTLASIRERWNTVEGNIRSYLTGLAFSPFMVGSAACVRTVTIWPPRLRLHAMQSRGGGECWSGSRAE